MDDIYKNIGEYNPNKRRKVFILSDDMIFVMVVKNPVVSELFYEG